MASCSIHYPGAPAVLSDHCVQYSVISRAAAAAAAGLSEPARRVCAVCLQQGVPEIIVNYNY